MNWYAIRSIFHFGKKENGLNIFEERIVVFCGKDKMEAFDKSEKETTVYANNEANKDFAVHSDMELYQQDGDPLIDGYEVWSQLFESTESLDDFFKNRYKKYEYHPDVK